MISRRVADPAAAGAPYRIGLVCLGNICRSPMADVVLNELLDRAGLAGRVVVDSCGTGGWHVGEPMDRRAAATLLAADFDPAGTAPSSSTPAGCERDLLLAMDGDNLVGLADLARAPESRTGCGCSATSTRSGGGDVPDPYYGGAGGFEEVLDDGERTSIAIVAGLERMLD